MDQQEIKKKFNKKQNRQLFLYILIIFITPMTVIFNPRGGVQILKQSLPHIFEYTIVGIILIVFICTVINWRCPVCGKFLPKDLFPKSCKKCKTDFK